MRVPIRSAARVLLHRAGLLHAIRWRNRKALRILMYHRFPAEFAGAFERQCAHLRRYFNPLPLDVAVQRLNAGQPLPDNPIVITVDDGHRDFRDVAYPILRRYSIPATVFLVSGYLDRQLWLWFDQIHYAFAHTQLAQVEIDLGDQHYVFALGSKSDRASASETVANAAVELEPEERVRFITDLFARLRIQLPAHPPQEFAPLTWDEVREMSKDGIGFGAHTMTHPVLSQVPDRNSLITEIKGSKTRLEQELDRPVTTFCYPNGRFCDVNDTVVGVVKEAGFEGAVLAESGLNNGASDIFRLRRIAAEPDREFNYFRQCAAGLRV